MGGDAQPAEGDDMTGIPREGDVIAAKFTVEKVLGVGGMGVVVAARHISLGQRVAIKFLRPQAAKHKEAVGRFLREARSTVGLQSAHVVRVTDVGTLDTGLPYMVMEHLAGEDLSSLLANRLKLDVGEAVDYVLQACEAIAEAHAAGIVHRDLKPSNLFLTRKPDGSPLVKVLDFGISKAVDASGIDQNLTATSSVMGSPIYMSPEQLRSSKRVDSRTDIWALGVIMFELVAGSPPFDDETMTGLCAKIIADEPPTLRQRRLDAPAAFEAIVARCLTKDVARRFQTVAELAMALKPFAASVEGQMAADRTVRIGLPFRAPMTSAPILPESPASRPHFAPAVSGSSPRIGESAATGFAETVATWQGTDGPKRRGPALVVVIALGAALIGAGAVTFLVKRGGSSESSTAAPLASTPAVIVTSVPTAPATVASAAPSASASAAPSTVASTKLAARPPVGFQGRPAAPGGATPPASATPPKPPAPPSTAGLLDDRR